MNHESYRGQPLQIRVQNAKLVDEGCQGTMVRPLSVYGTMWRVSVIGEGIHDQGDTA